MANIIKTFTAYDNPHNVDEQIMKYAEENNLNPIQITSDIVTSELDTVIYIVTVLFEKTLTSEDPDIEVALLSDKVNYEFKEHQQPEETYGITEEAYRKFWRYK